MDKSTPPDLISPEAARLIWADLLPDPPETGTALLRRTERKTGPPSVHVRGPGTGKRMYSAAAVRAWCAERQSPQARIGLRLLKVTNEAAAVGFNLEVEEVDGMADAARKLLTRAFEDGAP